MHAIRRIIDSEMISYCIYPLTILLAISTYALWSGLIENPLISAFGAVILGLSMIVLFEAYLPHRPTWLPNKHDVKNDLMFIAMIQVVLPRLLGFVIAVLILDELNGQGPLASLWPRDWPLAAQALLLVISADFFRYWLHRLSHTLPILWRLHAVHHSPTKLYWLNTSRFHPIEKTFQFFLDTLPFILMSVDARVLGFWFVIYSVNGFFQHSNIQLKFSWLSKIFSTAEVHRWHHSKNPNESNANYANVFIFWDRLFGTYFKPNDREVGELGLLNSSYPTSFIEQMKSPFITNLDQKEVLSPSFKELILNLLIKSRMLRTRLTFWWKLRKAAESPETTQLKVLNHILKKNAGSQYGLKYDFSRINSYADFSNKLPISHFEDLRPYIEHQRNDNVPALTSAKPVIYNTTSGTTGEPKYIPIIQDEINAQRRHGLLMTYSQYRHAPDAFKGKIWAIASPAIEGRFKNGTPWGSASGLLYANMSHRVASKYVIPPEVFEVENHELKYALILRLALAEKNITYLTCANPSTILKLCVIANSHHEDFIRDIEQGGFGRSGELPARIIKAINKHLKPQPERAAELRELYSSKDSVTFNDLWPYLELVSTWTFGNCAVPIATVRQQLPSSTKVLELGYLSSEFRGSLTVNGQTGAGLPTLLDYFFEFIEPEKWHDGIREFHQLHELEDGKDYYIVVTTISGLYRYFINDIVRVSGRFHNTPTLHFVQKGKGVTNITGEKLYESQVLEALKQAEAHFNISPIFFLMCADVKASQYRLLIEAQSLETLPQTSALAGFIEKTLSKLNIEYDNKSQSGRLMPLSVQYLKSGSGHAYRDYCVSSGQKDGQYKPIVLQHWHECRFNFDPHLDSQSNED